jgi:hypothetical protein
MDRGQKETARKVRANFEVLEDLARARGTARKLDGGGRQSPANRSLARLSLVTGNLTGISANALMRGVRERLVSIAKSARFSKQKPKTLQEIFRAEQGIAKAEPYRSLRSRLFTEPR